MKKQKKLPSLLLALALLFSLLPVKAMAADGDMADMTISGGETVSAGGTYDIKRVGGTTQGIITIATADPVTLTGEGITTDEEYENLYIKCTVSGVNLTIEDLFIENTSASTNTISFTGEGNYLYFKGTCIVDQNTSSTGYAMIHVGPTASLTVGGVTDDDTLYFYKREQGAGIGGDSGEYNGNITISGGNIFGKGSKQGAVIGSGSGARTSAGSPGSITINGGILNLIANARGALIGGGSGSEGGAEGANVYINGGTITLNVDYSGAAIGGGGYDKGNNAGGGKMYYSAGSIRTFIDYNAFVSDNNINLWENYGVTEYGVNDAAITASKVNTSGKSVYLCKFDTHGLFGSTDTFTVLDGSNTVYTGGLHKYCYVNESLQKNDQTTIEGTMDNWTSLDDSILYLYLTGENHTLTVNNKTFLAVWDADTSSFTITDGLQGDISGDGAVNMTDLSLLLTAYGTTDSASDINGDGIVNMTDLSLLLSAYGNRAETADE